MNNTKSLVPNKPKYGAKRRFDSSTFLYNLERRWRLYCRILNTTLDVVIFLGVYLYLTQPDTLTEVINRLTVWTNQYSVTLGKMFFWLQIYLQPGTLV